MTQQNKPAVQIAATGRNRRPDLDDAVKRWRMLEIGSGKASDQNVSAPDYSARK
jgi:hypothetical protein